MQFFSLLRRAAAGAAAGVCLALGPSRCVTLRRVWFAAGLLGWVVFGVYLVFAVLIAASA